MDAQQKAAIDQANKEAFDRQAQSARFKIGVADDEFNGTLAGVKFMDGVGYTDNASQAHTLAQYGHTVHDKDETPAKA